MKQLVDADKLPGFCQQCFCERCMRGFVTRIGDAVKFTTGKRTCLETGCSGEVRVRPVLGWKRLRPCQDGCARLRKALPARLA